MIVRLVVAGVSAAAFFASSASARDIEVDVSDLDFTNPTDVAVAYERVYETAVEGCERVNRSAMSSIGMSRRAFERLVDACVARAMDETVENADVAVFSAFHAVRLSDVADDAVQVAAR